MVGPPMTGLGGIQQYGRTLFKALTELGHNIVPFNKRDLFYYILVAGLADRIIVTHRNYLPLLLLAPRRKAILLLHGIDAEAPLTWLERLALKRVSTIWVISKWTKGLAKKFGKPTEILYLCVS